MDEAPLFDVSESGVASCLSTDRVDGPDRPVFEAICCDILYNQTQKNLTTDIVRIWSDLFQS